MTGLFTNGNVDSIRVDSHILHHKVIHSAATAISYSMKHPESRKTWSVM